MEVPYNDQHAIRDITNLFNCNNSVPQCELNYPPVHVHVSITSVCSIEEIIAARQVMCCAVGELLQDICGFLRLLEIQYTRKQGVKLSELEFFLLKCWK
jgi:hypothetical protein